MLAGLGGASMDGAPQLRAHLLGGDRTQVTLEIRCDLLGGYCDRLRARFRGARQRAPQVSKRSGMAPGQRRDTSTSHPAPCGSPLQRRGAQDRLKQSQSPMFEAIPPAFGEVGALAGLKPPSAAREALWTTRRSGVRRGDCLVFGSGAPSWVRAHCRCFRGGDRRPLTPRPS